MSDHTQKTTVTRLGFAVFLIVMGCATAHAASPGKDIKEGNRHYREGDYAASRAKYADALEKAPESTIVIFNLGTVLYKEDKYDDAVEYLQKALLTEDEALKQSAHYNLGNALYRAGMVCAGEDINAAIQLLEKAIEMERMAIADYNKIANFTMHKDHITYQLITSILADEVEHEEDLEMLPQ